MNFEPTAGEIRRGTGLLPAYFDQQRETLDAAASIMDNVTGGSGDTVVIDGQPRHVSGYLRDFLFPPERLHAPVSMLSGGERNRLLLARLFARPSNLLVMGRAHQRSGTWKPWSFWRRWWPTMRAPCFW